MNRKTRKKIHDHNFSKESFDWLKEKAVTFSDAVIAIIITVMVLEIPIPAQTSEYTDFIKSIIVFLISFFIIAYFWISYHRIMNGIHAFTKSILVINFIFLALLALLPVISKWVMFSGNTTSVMCYGILYLIVQLILLFMLYQVVASGVNRTDNIQILRHLFFGRMYLNLLLNVILIALANVAHDVIMVLYLAMPIVSFFFLPLSRNQENDKKPLVS